MDTQGKTKLVAIVDDDDSMRSALQGLLQSAEFPAQSFASAEEFLKSGQRHQIACLIADIRMPGMSGLELQAQLNAERCRIPIIFITAHGDEKMRMQALRAGAVEFMAKPFNDEALLESALESVLEQVERVAPTDSTVLVQGETGTGKELIARAIHSLSSRCGRPFIKLNCAAIPFDLLESELFGHEKGAFTGAIAQKIGRFELADKGTLFLDEVGDIPLPLQPKLLRVLQEQEFERLGSGRTHQVDVRLVAATHRNLLEMVKRNEFRSDLYYRLNVFPVPLPPLRARREDIRALVEHFVEIYARRMGRQIDEISAETMSELTSYPWPGNIRELQNFIERSVILTTGNVLESPLASLRNAAEAQSLGPITMEDAERDHIRKTLEQTRWVVSGPNGAAARLGIKRSTLYFRMQKLGISRTNKDSLPS